MRLIDSDALLELYADTEQINFAVYNVPVPVVRQNILDMPTIEAEPVRHGRWVKRGQDIFCSECDEESGYTWAGASRYSEYCPNCGAKMDKE